MPTPEEMQAALNNLWAQKAASMNQPSPVSGAQQQFMAPQAPGPSPVPTGNMQSGTAAAMARMNAGGEYNALTGVTSPAQGGAPVYSAAPGTQAALARNDAQISGNALATGGQSAMAPMTLGAQAPQYAYAMAPGTQAALARDAASGGRTALSEPEKKGMQSSGGDDKGKAEAKAQREKEDERRQKRHEQAPIAINVPAYSPGPLISGWWK